MHILKKIKNGFQILDSKIECFRFLSGNNLKIIAVLTMLIDHICKIVWEWFKRSGWNIVVLSGKISEQKLFYINDVLIGRLEAVGTMAFPLFCFLLVEGFLHTKNKKRYISIMLIFAVITEIPFDISFFSWYSLKNGTFPFYFEYQNVFFTLFLGLIALWGIEKLSYKTEINSNKIKSILLQIINVFIIAMVAKLIRCDYGSMGILIVVAFYLCRKNRIYQVLLFLVVYMFTTGNQPTIYIILSCLIILLYNGKRGKLKLKYFFYWFYPVHILILYLFTIKLEKMI